MKTYAQWSESRLDLGQFLQVGDVVDQEMADYFLCVLPPACMSDGIIQIGEPNNHVHGRATFATVKQTPNGWTYCGHCYRGHATEPDGDDWLNRYIAEQRANFEAAGITQPMLDSADEYTETMEVDDAAR